VKRLLLFRGDSCEVGEKYSNQSSGSAGRRYVNLWMKKEWGLKMSGSSIVLY